jgi:hypothetical protein
MTEFILGAIVILLTALLAEKAPPKWRKLLWGLFVLVVIAQTVVTIAERRTQRRESEHRSEVDRQRIEILQQGVTETKAKLDMSVIEQARMSAHLEAIQVIMEKSSQPGMKQLADALKQIAQPKAASQDSLKDRALAFANKLLEFVAERKRMTFGQQTQAPYDEETVGQYHDRFLNDALNLTHEFEAKGIGWNYRPYHFTCGHEAANLGMIENCATQISVTAQALK